MSIYQVHQMKFFPDFFDVLIKCQRLPEVTLKNVEKLGEEVKKLKDFNKDHKKLLELFPALK